MDHSQSQAVNLILIMIGLVVYLRYACGISEVSSEKWRSMVKNICCVLIAAFITMGYESIHKVRALEKRISDLEAVKKAEK